MAPQLQLSTYSEEFSYPAQAKTIRPRPTSAHRKNNPHPRPDFLLPRKLQTGYGHRTMFPTTAPPNNAPLFPPVRHVSVQCPDGKIPQTHPVLNPSHSDSQAAEGTVPSAGWLPKPQPANTTRVHQSRSSDRNMQSAVFITSVDIRVPNVQSEQPLKLKEQHAMKLSSSIPPIRPFKPQLTYSRPRSKSTPDSSGGYSCFHVVKPYKAGYYIIHPEFLEELARVARFGKDVDRGKSDL
ncbi:hypothetical protein AOLI_G00209260 [Acnodon oligacanthus]